MSHCYSVGVNINGKEIEVCTLVPGNEDLSKNVHDAEKKKTKPRNPTKEEIDRSIEFYLKKHNNAEHPMADEQDHMKDMLE